VLCLLRAQLCHRGSRAAVLALEKCDAPRAKGMLHVPGVLLSAPEPLLPGDVFSILYPDSVDKPHFFMFFFLVSGLLFHLPA